MTVLTALARAILNGERSVLPKTPARVPMPPVQPTLGMSRVQHLDMLHVQPQASERNVSFGPTGEIIVKTAQYTDHIFRGSVFLTPDQASYALSWGWALSHADSASGLLVMVRR